MSDSSPFSSLKQRAMDVIMRAWSSDNPAPDMKLDPSLPEEHLTQLHELMQDCLAPKGGEITARKHTVELGIIYQHLNEVGKERFLTLLAEKFGLDHAYVNPLIDQYATLNNQADIVHWEQQMRDALVTPRSKILKQFTALPDGFQFLVNMRADLLPLVEQHVALASLEFDLKRILASWFDVGLLDLVEINWEKTPPSVLEKLIAYEAVHKIRSWDDLKNRLDKDRKIYAFFHNKMPLEPLIFVQVAFTKGMASNIQEVLDTNSPTLAIEQADTALFYSISNAQIGLKGISFGNFLIKQVVAKLAEQYPHITSLATLSPVPGFCDWLKPLLVNNNADLISDAERKLLIESLETNWYKNPTISAKLEPILRRLCAHYLINEKQGDKPLDPVANFHLFNGARLERFNWLADVSKKGMKQSAGMMVNYHYQLDKIDENHENFITNRKIVASKRIQDYL